MSIHRNDYMTGKATHDEYYQQFVKPAHLEYLKKSQKYKDILASKDPHLNDIPLKWWDNLPAFGYAVPLKDVGETNSLSTHVCVWKSAARMLKPNN